MSEKPGKYKATAKQSAKSKTVAPTKIVQAKQPVLINVKPQTETARIEREKLPRVDAFAISLDERFPGAVNVLVDLALAILSGNDDLCAAKLDIIRSRQRVVRLGRGDVQ